jgi:hypothetical protein
MMRACKNPDPALEAIRRKLQRRLRHATAAHVEKVEIQNNIIEVTIGNIYSNDSSHTKDIEDTVKKIAPNMNVEFFY